MCAHKRRPLCHSDAFCCSDTLDTFFCFLYSWNREVIGASGAAMNYANLIVKIPLNTLYILSS